MKTTMLDNRTTLPCKYAFFPVELLKTHLFLHISQGPLYFLLHHLPQQSTPTLRAIDSPTPDFLVVTWGNFFIPGTNLEILTDRYIWQGLTDLFVSPFYISLYTSIVCIIACFTTIILLSALGWAALYNSNLVRL